MTVNMAPSENIGKRIIPQILDHVASTDPDRIVYSVAKSADISQGLRDITAQQFARAVDKTAWWLQAKVGKSTKLEALGYIGPRKFLMKLVGDVKISCTRS
jgi:malonyl CoA-acyl carrier protein transacylase